MTDFYYRSDVAGPGSGTLADPFNSLSSGAAGPNNRYFFYSTSLWSATGSNLSGFFPAKLVYDNVQLLAYGPSGSLPTFSGFRTPSWTLDPATGTYWTTVTYGGFVTRGGQALRHVHWPPGTSVSGGISSLIGSMPLDSYTLDYEDSPNRIYIRISGSLGDAPLQVSDVRHILNTNAAGSGANTGLVIDSLAFTGASRSALYVNRNVAQLRNLDIKFCGGERDLLTSTWVGSGIDLTSGADGSIVDNCRIGYVYAAPVFVELTGSGATLSNVTVQNSTLYESGRSGVELNVQNTSSSISGCTVQLNTVYNVGQGCSSWNASAGYTGNGVLLTADFASSSVTTNTVARNRIRNCQTGVTVNSRATSVNAVQGNLILNPGQQNLAGVTLMHGLGTSTLNALGNTVENTANAFDANANLGGTSFFNLINNTVVTSINAVRTNSSCTLTMSNNVIQGCTGQVVNGTVGTLITDTNYLSSNVSDGGYTINGNDVRGAMVSFDSTTSYVPVSGSGTYSGGKTIGSFFQDYNGNTFGTPSWPFGAYTVYSALPLPSSPSVLLVREKWFSILVSPSTTQFTWSARDVPLTDTGSGFFNFFE